MSAAAAAACCLGGFLKPTLELQAGLSAATSTNRHSEGNKSTLVQQQHPKTYLSCVVM